MHNADCKRPSSRSRVSEILDALVGCFQPTTASRTLSPNLHVNSHVGANSELGSFTFYSLGISKAPSSEPLHTTHTNSLVPT